MSAKPLNLGEKNIGSQKPKLPVHQADLLGLVRNRNPATVVHEYIYQFGHSNPTLALLAV